ncbi:VapC toxin family PIN domain ribonuclease [Nocardia halotolerans]|uniref:VapC toxin family PIN domain ribonuclease n=1 Tax=Nocardia halotolerans TaxID=1755878 RepID=A0ABV8VP43_9NOCA
MTGYLIDSSALWRILRSDELRETWRTTTTDRMIRSCYPQRTEFLSSSRNVAEFSTLAMRFEQLYREISVPKSAGSWIGTFQHRAAQGGCINAFSAVDLQICATAGYHDLIIVHDDKDFVTATRFATELREVNVHDGPLELTF